MDLRSCPLLVLLLCSCAIRSLHPAVPEGGDGVDTSVFEGAWKLVEIIDEDLATALLIDVAVGEPGELILSVRSGTQVVSRQGRVAELDGMVVLSIQDDAGTWNIVKIDLGTSDQTMTVFALDAEVLSQARDAGVLAAVQPGMSFRDGELEIQEDQADLAEFLRENPHSFSLQIASLRRVVNGSP